MKESEALYLLQKIEDGWDVFSLAAEAISPVVLDDDAARLVWLKPELLRFLFEPRVCGCI